MKTKLHQIAENAKKKIFFHVSGFVKYLFVSYTEGILLIYEFACK